MCGIFGARGKSIPLHQIQIGLLALQHRGQESAGLAYWQGGKLFCHRDLGLVEQALGAVVETELCEAALAHTRYGTRGKRELRNAQPLCLTTPYGPVAIAHNGQIWQEEKWRQYLQSKGCVFQSETDTEIFLHLLALQYPRPFEEALLHVFSQVEGAFSLLLLHGGELWAIRDPFGFRPLCLGQREDTFFVASESCAFSPLEVDFVRELSPGEVLHLSEKGPVSRHLPSVAKRAFCSFEVIYFAHEASLCADQPIAKLRCALGRALAEEEEEPCLAEVVVPLPHSAIPAGTGFAQALDLPLERALLRRAHSGRTFIEPEETRKGKLQWKFSLVPTVLEGKAIYLVDDSLVRGNTVRQVVPLLRRGGAKEIHLRIASPPVFHPCVYGIATPTYEELLANSFSHLEELARFLGVESVRYLSRDRMLQLLASFGLPQVCHACFSGLYPTAQQLSSRGCVYGSP